MGFVSISEGKIDLMAVYNSVHNPAAGAVVMFTGTVRNMGRYQDDDMEIVAMEVEAYSDMSIKKMNDVAEETKRRFDIHDITIVHRIGRLEAGEIIVAIAVSSMHRAEAFYATRYAIDRLKEIVPLWKKEIFKNGEERWVGIKPEG